MSGAQKEGEFLAAVARSTIAHQGSGTHFHASEHFMADAQTRVAIQNYLFAGSGQLTRARRRLPASVQPFTPILDAARTSPRHRYTIITTDSHVSGGNARNGSIHSGFNASIRRHNMLHSLNQITRHSRGTFLIGAFHGARRHTHGQASKTTTMLLDQDGWPLHVARIVVDVVGSA